jgi:N-acylneuraminate cytidylyltransferase
MICHAIILARGGSKGIKKKNLITLQNKPLLAWTIETTLNCNEISEVFVSSDSSEILDCARSYGAKTIKRPKIISKDTSTSEEGWKHAINHITTYYNLNPELILAPQPTSPIRSKNDFSRAIAKFKSENLDSLLSVSKINDYFIWEEKNQQLISLNYDFKNRKRRQLIVDKYHENGSFYLFKSDLFEKLNNRLGGKIGIYIMEKFKEFQIDEPDDILICESIMNVFKNRLN